MGKGVFISGLILGILGLLWSFAMLFILVVIVAIASGDIARLLVIPQVAFFTAIVTIVGAVLARTRDALGAWIVLAAGAATVGTALAVSFSVLSSVSPVTSILGVSLIVVWWAYLTLIAGAVSLVLMRRL